MGVVLALDCATHTGAAWDSDVPGVPALTSFVCKAPHREPDGGQSYGQLFDSFSQWVIRKIVSVKPDVVAFEAPLPFMAKTNVKISQPNRRVLYGLAAIVEAAAANFGACCLEASPQQIKHHFTGNHLASKGDMMLRCRALRWRVVGDDEADAAALWSLAKCLTDPKWNYASGPLFDGKRA